jgi:cytoskeletal protein CcmA (bactofilin family)
LTRGGGAPDDSVNEGRSLVVGREICLSGEIKSCERLVIEGKVELSLAESRVLEVTEHGIYQGDAVVENCTIAGLFKGNLSARGRVTLKSTGRIIGTLRYGELEIERGGKASGTLEEAGAAPTVEPGARTKPSATLLDDGPAEGEKSIALEPADEPAAEPADAPADQTRPDEPVKAVDAG